MAKKIFREREETERFFVLSEDIENEIAGEIIHWIYSINQEDQEKENELVNYQRKPIELLINTFGGSVYDTFAIVNAITTSKTPVITTCVGSAMSGGLYVLAAGHIRLACEHANFMYHECSADIVYTYKNKIIEKIDEINRVQSALEDLLCKRTKLTRKILQKYNDKRAEWFFGPEEAINFKIVDGIYNKV
jgi:ATP-dependent Clp protease protease subunit